MMGNPYYPQYQTPYYPPQMPDPMTLRQMQSQPPAQPQPMAQPQAGPSFALVNGEQEARDFVVLPGNSVFLMSRNEPVFWLKSTDQSGLSAPLRAFDFQERLAAPQTPVQSGNAPGVEYVPRQEYEALRTRVDKLEAKKCACLEKADAKEVNHE